MICILQRCLWVFLWLLQVQLAEAIPFQASVTPILNESLNFRQGVSQKPVASIQVQCDPSSQFSIHVSSEYGRYFIIKEEYTGHPGEMLPFSVDLIHGQASNLHYSPQLGQLKTLESPVTYGFTSTGDSGELSGPQTYLLRLHSDPNTSLFSGKFSNTLYVNIVEQP